MPALGGPQDRDDLVDEFHVPFVRALGNLVIMYAQSEAALLTLVAALKSCDEKDAQAILKREDAKDQVLKLVSQNGLRGFELQELLETVDAFWQDRLQRHRYMHDEWYVTIHGEIATRGHPRRKGTDIVYDEPTPDDVWNLALRFREYDHLFSYVTHKLAGSAGLGSGVDGEDMCEAGGD